MQDWFEFEARCEIALYTGSPMLSAQQTHHSFRDLGRSMLLRAQPIRVLSRSLLARLELAATPDPASLKRVAKVADKLAGEGVGYAQVNAHLLRAAVARQLGQEDVVVAELRKSVALAEENSMGFQRAAAQRQLGRTLSGSEGMSLIATSDAWLAKEGIINAERMCDVVAPGFTRGK